MLSFLGLAAIARLASAATCTGCTSTDNDCVEFVAGSVYGCDGEWANNGVSNGAYLCAAGYEICPTDERAAELGLTAELCTSEILTDGDFYATLQGATTDAWPSCGDGGTDDVFGCARNALRPDGNYAYTEAQYQSDQMNNSLMYDCGPFKAAIGQDVGWGDPVPKWGCCSQSVDEVNDLKHESAEGGGVLCCKEPGPYGSNFFVDDVSGTLAAQPAAAFGQDPPCVSGSFETNVYATYTCAEDKMSVSRKQYSDSLCLTQVGDTVVFRANDTDPVTFEFGFYCGAGVTSYVELHLHFYDEDTVANPDCDIAPGFGSFEYRAVDNCYAGEDTLVGGTSYMIYEKYACDAEAFTVTEYYDDLCTVPVNSSLTVGDECTPFAHVVVDSEPRSVYATFTHCVIDSEFVTDTDMPTPSPSGPNAPTTASPTTTAPPAKDASAAPGYEKVVAAVLVAAAGAVLRE